MTTLRSQIDRLTYSFIDAVMDVACSSSMREVMTHAAKSVGPTPRRLPRRSLQEIASRLDEVVALVKRNKDGLRAEHIRRELGLQAKELPRVLKEGLATKVLRSKGNKRGTIYLAT